LNTKEYKDLEQKERQALSTRLGIPSQISTADCEKSDLTALEEPV
jgi:hypothetical protein